MSSKINLQTCEYACKSSIFQDNQLIFLKFEGNAPDYLEQELKACADMADMLDNKMFSLNQAITKIAEEQAKEKEAAKVAEEMKKAEREDVPAGNEQEPKDGKRSGEAASGNRKEAGE